MKYELVPGLETHVELSTKTKIFCSRSTEFGGEPNTHCCPVCVGFPGTLPKLNQKVVEYAIMAGLTINCEISNISRMDHKNYCYPDLPKAYQISQFDMPLCKNGHIDLSNGCRIRINRIHIEEDADKLVHQGGNTYVDYNHGGVPLIEIVTEPDFCSSDEVHEYVEKLQLAVKFIGVSDRKMQGGSIRCDVNTSVRLADSEECGTRTEIKNMNSITFMTKAIDYEYTHQIDALENGEKVTQEALRYNESDGTTSSTRDKEDADDYRYFHDPDLVDIHMMDGEVDAIRRVLLELPEVKRERYISQFRLPKADALQLTKSRAIAEFFKAISDGIASLKTVVNYIIGQIFHRMENGDAKERFEVSVPASYLKDLVLLLDSGKIRMNLLKSTLDKMLDSGKPATEFLSESDLSGVGTDDLKKFCEDVAAANPNAVADYRVGKEKALGALLGSVMKASRGRADALKAERILIELISQGQSRN